MSAGVADRSKPERSFSPARSLIPVSRSSARSSNTSGGRDRSRGAWSGSRIGAAQPYKSTTATRISALDDVPRFKILRHEYQFFHHSVKALLAHDDPQHRARFDQVLVPERRGHLEHPALVVVGLYLELARAELLANLEVREQVRVG